MNAHGSVPPFELPHVETVRAALQNDHKLLQIIIGPRQVGKSTIARQIAAAWEGDVVSASADDPLPPGPEWVQHHWERARAARNTAPLLILDEIQKVRSWSETVKALWDEDIRRGAPMHVLILGSSSLLIQRGLSESLSGRFLLHRVHHWSYGAMRAAFGLDLDRWIYAGGYPGSVPFLDQEETWKAYIRDSLVETVITRDVLQMQNVAKPALLRHLFLLSAAYPAQILSYNKMLGQLTDAGNTTTLAHYVRLLETAFLLSGLEQYKIGGRPKRGSSPKLVLRNNALVSALSLESCADMRANPELWGRLVENAVGATLLNQLQGLPYEVYYWRKAPSEVDFVVHTARGTWAVEVKSSRSRGASGLRSFLGLHPRARPLIVGGSGMELEEFFLTPMVELFS
jgi:uncharacterized protein